MIPLSFRVRLLFNSLRSPTFALISSLFPSLKKIVTESSFRTVFISFAISYSISSISFPSMESLDISSVSFESISLYSSSFTNMGGMRSRDISFPQLFHLRILLGVFFRLLHKRKLHIPIISFPDKMGIPAKDLTRLSSQVKSPLPRIRVFLFCKIFCIIFLVKIMGVCSRRFTFPFLN